MKGLRWRAITELQLRTLKFQNFVVMLNTNHNEAFFDALCSVLNMIALRTALLKNFQSRFATPTL